MSDEMPEPEVNDQGMNDEPVILPGTDIRRLSVSQVNAFTRCARSWAYNRVAKIGSLMPGRVHSGSAMDAALNYYWNQRIGGRDPHPDDVKEIYSKTLHEILTKNEFILPDTTAFEDGPRLIDVFCHDTDIVNMTPVETQRKLDFTVGGIPFRGYADLITAVSDTPTGLGHIIADHKFTGRTPDRTKTERSLQLCLYSIAIHTGALSGFRAVRLINLVRLKREPKVVIHTHFVGEKQIADAERHVKNVFARMHMRHYPMTSPEDTFTCDPDNCSYWNICRGRDGGPTPIDGEYTP